MRNGIVRVYTADNLNLQGLLWCPEQLPSKPCVVIHVHGSYGNCYENFFIEEMASRLTLDGVSFLSVNTRGRDYYADFKMKRPDGGYDSRRIGGIQEIFEECLLDIGSWMAFAQAEGFQKVILQGHSLGAMKVAYYVGRAASDPVSALFLLSPPDNYGLQHECFGKRFQADLQLASQLCASDPEALMPAESYFDPITAAAYVALLGDESKTGMFSYYDGSIVNNPITNSIAVPTFAVFGTEAEAITLDTGRCLDLLSEALTSAPRCQTAVLKGANHSYHNHEKEISSLLAEWCTAIEAA